MCLLSLCQDLIQLTYTEKQEYEIQFLVQRHVWYVGSNNLTSAHGGSACKVTELLKNHNSQWAV
jgi:hypothetical protein